MRKFVSVAVLVVSSLLFAACGEKPSGGGGTPPPTNTVPGAPTNVVGTAGNAQVSVAFVAPASNGGAVITSYTATCSSSSSGSTSGTVSGTGSPIVVIGLTNGDPYTCTAYATNSVGNGPASAASATVTPTAPATVPSAPTNVVGVPGNAQITVNFNPPASNGGASITSYTATCTSSTDSKSTTSITTSILVTGLTNGASYTCTVYATNSVGNSPASSPSAAVTPTLPAPTLTSVTPTLMRFLGRAFQTFTLTGTNFTSDSQLNYIGPTASATLNSSFTVSSSTQISLIIQIDPSHMAYGNFQFAVCKSDGVSCSGSLTIGFYGKKLCDHFPNGEKICANSLNGNVDFFAPITGAFEKSLPSSGPEGFNLSGCGMAVDQLTGYWSNGGQPVDQSGSQSDTPIVVGNGGSYGPCVANAAGNGFAAEPEPTVTNGLAYASWLGNSPTVVNTVVQAYAGTNPQSLAIGVTSGKAWAYVFDASVSGTPAVGKVDMTDGATTTAASSPTTGITAGAPAGSLMAVFDSLGLGTVVSIGDNAANVFSESTLKTVTTVGSAGIITLPTGKTPVSIITVGSVAVLGNSDGTFTELNPTTGTAALIPSATTSFMPIGLVPAVAADGTGVDFYACPQDEVSPCRSFKLP